MFIHSFIEEKKLSTIRYLFSPSSFVLWAAIDFRTVVLLHSALRWKVAGDDEDNIWFYVEDLDFLEWFEEWKAQSGEAVETRLKKPAALLKLFFRQYSRADMQLYNLRNKK